MLILGTVAVLAMGYSIYILRAPQTKQRPVDAYKFAALLNKGGK